MGGSSSPPANTTTTTTQDLPKWIAPFSKMLLRRGVDLSKMPYTPYGGQRVAGMTPDQLRAGDYTRRLARGGFDLQSRYINPDRQRYLSSARGDYLSPEKNPWLRKTYDAASLAATDAYRTGTAAQTDATAAMGRAFGGSAWNERTAANERDLGRTLNELGTNIYGQNYQTERDRQMAAIGSLAGLSEADIARRVAIRDANLQRRIGGVDALYKFGLDQKGINQQQLDALYNEWLKKKEWPLRQLDILGNVIGMSMGKTGSQTTTGPSQQPQFNPWQAIGGLGLGLAGLYQNR